MIGKIILRDRWLTAGIVVATLAAVSAAAVAIYGWREFGEYQQSHRSERAALPETKAIDIRADQDIAEWSYSLLIVGVAGSLLSVAGMVVIGLTLRETRRATETTREIGQLQTKAYLRATSAHLFQHSAGTVGIEISYVNEGETPAVAVRDKVMLGHATLPGLQDSAMYQDPPRAWHRRSPVRPGGTEPIKAKSLLPEYDLVISRIRAAREGAHVLAHPFLILRGVVLYRDVFGQQYRTEFIFCSKHELSGGRLELSAIDDDIPHFRADDRKDPPIVDDRAFLVSSRAQGADT